MAVDFLPCSASEDAVGLHNHPENFSPHWVRFPILGQGVLHQHVDIVPLHRPCYNVMPHLVASRKGLVSEQVAVAIVRPSRKSAANVGMTLFQG